MLVAVPICMMFAFVGVLMFQHPATCEGKPRRSGVPGCPGDGGGDMGYYTSSPTHVLQDRSEPPAAYSCQLEPGGTPGPRNMQNVTVGPPPGAHMVGCVGARTRMGRSKLTLSVALAGGAAANSGGALNSGGGNWVLLEVLRKNSM